jgi:protein dithiol:quinone oxidoreductase
MWENHAMRLSPRIVFAAIAAACASLIAAAIFYFQDQLGLEPCPMCILQRYAFIAVGAVALVAAIHGARRLGLRIYAGLIVLFSIAGAGVAIRHSYLQHFPPARETCGADLDFLLNNFSLAEAFPKIFAGTGSCSKVDWTFLGLSIPEWALVWFVAFAALALWVAFFRKQEQ